MATACRQIWNYRKAGRGEPVEFPTWATLVVSRRLVFPSAREEPSLFKASECPIQSAMGRETTSAFQILDLLRDSEAMKLLAPLGPKIHCSNKNRLFDWNECARLASHNLIIADICALESHLKMRWSCLRSEPKACDACRPGTWVKSHQTGFTQGNLICLCRAWRRMRFDRPLEYYLGVYSMDWRGAPVSQVPARPVSLLEP